MVPIALSSHKQMPEYKHAIVNVSNTSIIGSHNIVNGSNNRITGDHNIINGSNCKLFGNHNIVNNKCDVTGNHNIINGDGSHIFGKYNTVNGEKCTGPGATNSGGSTSSESSTVTFTSGGSIFTSSNNRGNRITGPNSVVYIGSQRGSNITNISKPNKMRNGDTQRTIIRIGGGGTTQTFSGSIIGENVQFGDGMTTVIRDGDDVQTFGSTSSSIQIDDDDDLNEVIELSKNNRNRFLIPEAKEEQDATDDVPEDKLCIICLIKKKTTVIADCGHSCMCNSCSRELLKRDNKSCPICRKDIYIGITQLYE